MLCIVFAVNTKAFLVKKEEEVREDELFFYRYVLLKLMLCGCLKI